MTVCACGALRPADCAVGCGNWRAVVREELARRPDYVCARHRSPDEGCGICRVLRSRWRDFERKPCARGCSQGYVCVAAPDGTFGWVMTRCPRCNADSTGAAPSANTIKLQQLGEGR